ncbi:MAG: UDP-N-acetylmuramate dehydrogenase [Duodenibacillus sp.]|nr:UDP-N-acetylmuramate dehydrogenase [Duodenibacillus sp.]
MRENVELAPYTTFGVSAKARFFAEPQTLDELKAVLSEPDAAGLPRLVLGGGSNILFTHDFDGLVIRLRMDALELEDENDGYRFVRIGAGADWSGTVAELISRGWGGLENLSLVPGTVGGAAVQNIGAYGLEAAERIVEVECLDPKTLQTVTLSVDECDYAYRTSAFKHDRSDLIVVSVLFALPKRFEPRVAYKELAAVFGDKVPESAAQVAEAVIAIRRRKLPDPRELGSAGSFFKNPVVTRVKMNFLLDDDPRLVAYPLAGGRAKLAAGWLIEAVGMKGIREGDAGVFPRNALVLVNYGTATGAQILALSQKIQAAVKKRFGVALEPEPVII